MLLLLEIAVKFSLYLAALAAIGLAIHAAIGLPFRKRLILCLTLAIPVIKLAHLLLLNAQLSGALANVFDFSMFDWIWPLHQAQVVVLTIGCMVIAGGVLLNRVFMAFIGAIILAISFGLAGHTQGLEQAGFASLLVMLHAAVAGFWFAAPITLDPNRHQSPETLLINADRFSALAVWIVPVIFLSGMTTLWLLIGSVHGILFETYGQLLLGKLFLASAALALGALNKNYFSKLMRSAPTRGSRLFALSLRGEIILFTALILMLVFATTVTGPS